MPSMHVRPARADDLPVLVGLWLEKMTILASSDRRFAPSASATDQWLAEARAWLDNPTCYLVTACEDERRVGYALGARLAAIPGIGGPPTGVISQIAIDAHGYYGGAGRLLIDGLRAWFTGQQIERILVIAPHRYPAEQAFWRALGAVDWMDMLWLK